MSAKRLLIITLLASMILLVLTEPVFEFINQGLLNNYEGILLAPLFFILISYSAASLLLLFFSNQIFQLWLRKIVSWFLPLSAIFIWFGSGGNDFVSPSETGMAIIMGWLILGITLGFVIIQKFYFKR